MRRKDSSRWTGTVLLVVAGSWGAACQGPSTTPTGRSPAGVTSIGYLARAPGGQADYDGAIQLSMTAAGKSQQVTLSAKGSTTTLLAEDGSPLSAISFDYRSEAAVVTDYLAQTYTTTTVDALVSSVVATRAAIAGATAPATTTGLKRTGRRQQIAGLAARLYVTTVAGVDMRSPRSLTTGYP